MPSFTIALRGPSSSLVDHEGVGKELGRPVWIPEPLVAAPDRIRAGNRPSDARISRTQLLGRLDLIHQLERAFPEPQITGDRVQLCHRIESWQLPVRHEYFAAGRRYCSSNCPGKSPGRPYGSSLERSNFMSSVSAACTTTSRTRCRSTSPRNADDSSNPRV